jgi:chorismate mutase/prephenate dehydratase
MPPSKRGKTEQFQDRIEAARRALDRIDSHILRLLHERLDHVREIGRLKHRMSSGTWVPAREKAILERLVKENRGKFPENALSYIFREIFSISRQQEKPIQVVYYGQPGSLTHAAATEQFGSSTEYAPSGSLEEVFDRVGGSGMDYGFVPVDVSCEGIVSHSLEIFLRTDLRICAEYFMNLELVLATSGGRRIKALYMQPQVYGLVREWIGLNLPTGIRVEMVPESREAGAACQSRPGAACITQPFTARYFGLKILKERIPYGPQRQLRFLTAGREIPRATSSDKTTIAFSVADRVGVLEETLRPFRRHKVNLSFLESYPASKASPTVTFFMDVMGHMDQPVVVRAVDELRKSCAFVKVLGSYPVFRQGPE